MANPLPLVGLATDEYVRSATISMTNEDADYPATNAQNDNPALVAKSTTTTTTFTITTTSFSPRYLAIINSSAETGTINGDTITLPGLDAEGQRLNAVLDMGGSPPGAGTTWTIVLSRASGILWVGRIALFDDIHELNVKYGWTVGATRPGEVRITTRGGVILKHTQALRTRWAEGVVDLLEDETLIKTLDTGAKGDYFPFLLIPDEEVNDGWWVHQTVPYAKSHPDIDVRETKLRFEELTSGPVNG